MKPKEERLSRFIQIRISQKDQVWVDFLRANGINISEILRNTIKNTAQELLEERN